MLRQKRTTPIRPPVEDASLENPLRALQSAFVQWTRAVGLSEQTALIRSAALNFFIRWCHESNIRTPGELSRDVLEAYQGHLADYRKRNGEPLELATRLARLHPVRAFCKWLVRQRVVAIDPSAGMVMPKCPRRLPRVPSVAQVQGIFDQANRDSPSRVRDRTMMEMLYSTALRRTELARLRISEVDLESREVHVRSGKGNRDRVVPLGSRSGAWIERYLREVRPLLASGLDRGELFLTDYGEPFRKNRLGDHLQPYVRRAGLRGACHLFRHACATHMLENGADIRFIQAMLGHSQLTTTEIYTHVSIAKLREVHAATHPACRRGESAQPQSRADEAARRKAVEAAQRVQRVTTPAMPG